MRSKLYSRPAYSTSSKGWPRFSHHPGGLFHKGLKLRWIHFLLYAVLLRHKKTSQNFSTERKCVMQIVFMQLTPDRMATVVFPFMFLFLLSGISRANKDVNVQAGADLPSAHPKLHTNTNSYLRNL